MATLTDLQAKWEAWRADPLRAGSLVPLELVCAEVLADLKDLAESNADVVTIPEAHEMGGFSTDHLQRLVSRGKIENVGRKGSPRIRRTDVPIKPGHSVQRLRAATESDQFSPRRRMALAVITSQHGGAQ